MKYVVALLTICALAIALVLFGPRKEPLDLEDQADRIVAVLEDYNDKTAKLPKSYDNIRSEAVRRGVVPEAKIIWSVARPTPPFDKDPSEGWVRLTVTVEVPGYEPASPVYSVQLRR